jgi:hypothetical protein
MRKTLCATILVLALCGSTLAGDVNNPPLDDPIDMPNRTFVPPTSGEETADDIIQDDTTNSVAAALTLLNTVLALL